RRARCAAREVCGAHGPARADREKAAGTPGGGGGGGGGGGAAGDGGGQAARRARSPCPRMMSAYR
ncbi:hypothetical protein, partial [Streptomyces sp. PU_AKi4]|uniref:hypothetical protein n=1 Tax=Streptomyces sp. PU_AKi4 TaxID=2800809 RepID=UPI0035259932